MKKTPRIGLASRFPRISRPPNLRTCPVILVVGIAALLLPIFGASEVRAATLDLGGANTTLPDAPDFPTSYLSGSNDVTNSGANATLSEGGGPAASTPFTGLIANGAGTVALTHTSG